MKNLKFLSFPFFALLMSCGAAPSASELDAILPIDPQSTLDIGRGVNSLSREARGDCVKVTTPQKVFATNGKSIRMSIEKIESSQDLMEKLDFSAEANYGMMASGKASFAKSTKINDYSIYVIGKVKVMLNTETMRDVELKPADYTLAEQNFARFYERCGDEFVIGRTMGGEMFTVLEIKTHSKEEKKKIEASIKGSYGAFSGSASFSSSLENITKNNSTKFTLYQDGGVYQDVDLSADSLIKKLVNFPASITKENAWPTSITTASYSTLSMPETPSQYQMALRQNTLTDYEKFLRDYADFRSTIQYIRANPSEFVKVDDEKLQIKLTEAIATVRKITKLATDCYNTALACDFDSTIKNPKRSDLPSRIEAVEVVGCMDKRARNYNKEANKAALCSFHLLASIDYVIATKTEEFDIKKKTYEEAIDACKIAFKDKRLSDGIISLKVRSVSCEHMPDIDVDGFIKEKVKNIFGTKKN